MMIMNPASYRSIHSEPNTSGNITYMTAIANWSKSNVLRITVTLLLALLLFTSFMLMGIKASGTAEPTEHEQVVIVGSGDSLWSIARRYASPRDDVRYVVHTIKNRNNLNDTLIVPGQQLIIPDF
ncbi:LysM peptidoglycan-binding domain-containing protein [Paenibacillus paeoniae]|uniref:LysM peptidoglycan-binding domain-containing protein n=1 Tax=Paenibacillus paeoniae TaxID=2292705 RepID=A0A371PLP2_9BACL|nr:LysM peptidoglycan-binding domain-containing protein [Paenibacillus paeoniae]REK77130.1 LysM peptidoglycan-binding domain-containing protein [Paenibacillus paeoniae]